MDSLIETIDKLLLNDDESSASFYTILSNYKVEKKDIIYINEILLPKIYYLYSQQTLRKDLIYLSLLASENNDLLHIFLNYDKSVFKLNVKDPVSLYDYYIYYKQHWFYHIINTIDQHTFFSKNIYTKVQLLKLVQLTNSYNLNLPPINALLSQINANYLDDFWKFYLNEVGRLMDVMYFCKNESKKWEIFAFASRNSLLSTLSTYMNFDRELREANIAKKLEHFGEIKQLNVFTGYTIMANMINLLLNATYTGENRKNGDVNSAIDAIKIQLIALEDKQLQIELLENIFSLIFNRRKNDFTCKEKEIRLVLFLLKIVMDEIKAKNVQSTNSGECKRLTNLNIYLSDALWRLDLVINVNSTPKVEDQLMNYMLAPPPSLIHICLKRQHFQRANQVIHIFNLEESDIAQEIRYNELLHNFRKTLRKTPKLARAKSITDFFESNLPPGERNHAEILEQFAGKLDYTSSLLTSNETFINLFDLALTHSFDGDDSAPILALLEKQPSLTIPSHYHHFYTTITSLTYHTIPGLLLSPQHPLNVAEFAKKRAFLDDLQLLYDAFNHQISAQETGVLNKAHSCHKTLLKINDLCSQFASSSPYLQKVYNYLHAFSNILYIEQDSSDIISRGLNTSFFEILNFNRSELTGKLLFERHLDPAEFEKYFGKLKLDFLYHVVGNCFPTINLHVQENITLEEMYHDNMLYIPSQAIIVYIQKRNWLLAFILNEMYRVEGVRIDISEVRLQKLFNYMKLARVQTLKVLFDRNEIVTALQHCISPQKLKIYFEEQIVKQDLISIASDHSSNSNECYEQAEEVLEDVKMTNWRGLLNVIDSIPKSQLKKKNEFIRSRNSILLNLVQDCFEADCYKYVRFISSRELRIDTILNNAKKWPGRFVSDIIKAEVTKFDACEDQKMERLHKLLQKVELCEKLKPIFEKRSWYKTYEVCKRETEPTLFRIIQLNDVTILLDYIQIFKPNELILLNVDANYLTKIIELNTPLTQVKKLLDHLPFSHTIAICKNLLTILRNLEYLNFVANYLNDNVSNDAMVKNVQASLKMLTVFSPNEREHFFCLISEPLHIVEVLVMNTKFDKLPQTLEVLSNSIGVEKIDQLLRTYAEKSLDFRVITQSSPQALKAPEHKLLQSLDSLNLEKRPFSVPENVPSKDEWVHNEEVIECMCCEQVTFSMFNRRHHCRRCGRVVCHNCSQKRMLVQHYGDILVRVCADCFEQTVGHSCSSERSDALSSRSLSQEYWLLNDDPEHNQIVRDEFSYEHAPSISLCLNILKYHSKSAECPKFLLKKCEVMLDLLKPKQGTAHEIDYMLVIKMLKSLAVAAKMLSNEHMLNSGVLSADRIISQAELLALLAEKRCLNLMAESTSYVAASVLRRLRDKLLQKEQWTLALEVSTKAGLDNTGVFAVWGISCLKAGSLLLAREKLQRCLDKHTQYDIQSNTSRDLNRSTDSLNAPRSRYSSRISTLSAASERPTKNPPLLNEIVQVLETKTRSVNATVLNESSHYIKITDSMTSLNHSSGYTVQTDTAISIMNRLKGLKDIASGHFALAPPKSAKPTIDPLFYDECVFYLNKYGSHQSLLEFYVKHGDLETGLVHILENRLASDAFVDMYVKCLQYGVVGELQEHMSKLDSSLDLWKDHLRQICCHLEQQNLLNCLYQLQLHIGDYVRAAMTCIRFYQDNVRSFGELANNVAYLQRGEQHLRQVLEQEQWVEVTSVGRLSMDSKESFEEKMLANPDLVMKINIKDVDKHINTFQRQIEVVEFLAQREASGAKTTLLIKDIQLQREAKTASSGAIPTLFGSTFDKITLAVLAMLTGENIEDGFPLAMAIIGDFKLRPIRVYCVAGKQLAKMEHYKGITQLVNCIKSAGINDTAISDKLDEMLTQAVATLIKADVSGTKVEDLIKLIKDRTTKITCYIEAKQLKTAYFLAVKYRRTADIRRVQREAELLNMPAIKALCQKYLQNWNSPQTHAKDNNG